jgi:hypothetical protein
MTDRGGLNYPIRVRDEFSKTTAKFREEIRSSKAEFRDFQKVVRGQKSAAKEIRDQAKATKELAKAQRELSAATKSVVKPLTDEERATRAQAEANRKLARELDLASKAQRARERTAIALRNAAQRDANAERARIKRLEREALAQQRVTDSKNEELVATRRLESALFKEAVVRKQIELLKARSLKQFGEADFAGGSETLRRAKALEKSLKTQVSTAQKLLFTFRRLVGVLAIFTLARRGFQEFQNLVKEGVKFNDTVANAQLGIAGLVTTLGDVRDAQGQSVDATQRLGLALGLAREQTAKLRQDSLRTVATFEQLLDTFQVSVGPGLAAGLNLDEVRKLTVDISQAAAALGVPQNQLAEEVRSLLSGTIQARTTRIATALGISNEDVRRLKETGELFDFLEEKFAGFAEAAQQQARTTFSGITTLIKGLVQEILGEAAAPLFESLISASNDLFDNFLSIKDAAGNIKPSPDVVAAFQQVFDAIKRVVESVRELSSGGTGLSTLETTMAAIAISIDFIRGVVVALISAFQTVGGVVQQFAQFMGATTDNTAAAAAFAGKWLVNLLLIKKALSSISLSTLKIVTRGAIVVGIFTAIAKGVEFVLEKIFDIDLGIRDTIQLISLGLLGAFFTVQGSVQRIAESISNFFGGAIDAIVSKAKSSALKALGFVNAELLFDDAAAQAFKDAAFEEEQALEKLQATRKAAHKVEIDDINAQTKAKLKGVQDEIAATIAARAKENAKGEGFRSGFDPKQAAKDAADAAKAFVSTANRSVSDLGESLAKVNEEIIKAGQEFEQAQRSTGAGGVSGQIEGAFNKEEIAAAERLRKIKGDLANVESEIIRLREASGVSAEREAQIHEALLTPVEDREKALKRLLITEGEGGLVSALQDQLLLQTAIANSEEQSLELAGLKAATIAANTLPAIREEAALLQAEVASERAKTAAIQAQAGDRQLALVSAQQAVALAQAELAAQERKNALEIQSFRTQRDKLPLGSAERGALNATIKALSTRQRREAEILRFRLEQLQVAEREAELVLNGSLNEGFERGFDDFANNFSSKFQAGIEIATTALQGFVSFASQAIVDVFDPTKDAATIKENFARLLQQIAQVILQKLIELAIAKALISAGFGGDEKDSVEEAQKIGSVEVATAIEVASIRLANATAIAAILAGAGGGFSTGGVVPPGGFAKGGEVPDHESRRVQGFRRGGRPRRPRHIPASDTVPAWLTPGEFVMSRPAVKSFGLPMLEAMNGGTMPVVGSASAEAAGPSTGMQSGGLVSDRIANANAGAEGAAQERIVVVPAVVAGDREMDALSAGGRNALLAFMRENAGNINTLLDRSNGRN